MDLNHEAVDVALSGAMAAIELAIKLASDGQCDPLMDGHIIVTCDGSQRHGGVVLEEVVRRLREQRTRLQAIRTAVRTDNGG